MGMVLQWFMNTIGVGVLLNMFIITIGTNCAFFITLMSYEEFQQGKDTLNFIYVSCYPDIL